MSERKNHARAVELSDYFAIMRTSSGRGAMGRILTEAGVFAPTYVKGDLDETVRRSVRRDFGLWIERELKEAAPGEYAIMLKELEDERRK